KSRGCLARTMEIFRQWGIEQRVRERGLPEESDIFVFVSSIAGREFGRTRPEPNLGQTPAWKSMVAQDVVEEEILRELSDARHASVRFGLEVLSFEESEDGVRVQTRSLESGERTEWRALYLIAADGAASATRRAAGIAMEGPATLAVMSNEYWHG